jgi:excisionase family DNA binding protein
MRRSTRWRADPGRGGAPPDVIAVATVPALLSVATVARLLDCSPRTVRRRIAEGVLPAVIDHGRVMIRGDDLRAYVDALERVGGGPPRVRQPASARHAYDFLR